MPRRAGVLKPLPAPVDRSTVDISVALADVVSLGALDSEHAVLERLVEVAGRLTAAGHAAAMLVGADGQPAALAHREMNSGEVASLPHLLRPVGLIAAVLKGETIRLADMRTHPDAVGFPAGHPKAAFLGVPVAVSGRMLGGLYLTRAPEAGEFTAEDLARAQAAAEEAGNAVHAIRGSRAHDALIDRLGAADSREDDAQDGRSPGIRRLLTTAREVLGMDVSFLSRLHGDEQTFTRVDAVAGASAPAEGMTGQATDGYCALMLAGQVPASVPDVPAHPVLGPMNVTAALGVGAYCGVPVPLPDGTLYGTLCGLDPRPGIVPDTVQMAELSTIARLIGIGLQREIDGADRRRAAAAAFQPLVDGPLRAAVLQPIVDLRDGTTVGWEALSRFRETTGAPRRPDEVFERARQLGLGVRLEQAAARAALALLPDLPPGAYLSANLSPQALLDPGTFDLLAAAAARGGADRVLVEITEHEQVPDYPALLRVTERLRAMGLRIAVDDVGAGFASMQHITRLRPDVVKLDIAFVRDVHPRPGGRSPERSSASHMTSALSSWPKGSRARRNGTR
jgi:EAL domain-containing protein (putative c-di-GMP-specific phosphodiesterase class I)